MTITFAEQKQFSEDELKDLYDAVGWSAYTQDIGQLEQAVASSLYVLCARDGEQLVGLIRIVGDGLTIIYIQDILVKPDRQNQGIATTLINHALEKFKNVRQKVLLTEEAPDVRYFYEKNGFTSCDNGTLVAFAKMN